MAVARDDLGRPARKRGIEGQETIIRHFGIRCMENRAEFIPHKLSWVFREDSQSELILTMPSVNKPIRARSPNSGETAGY